MEYSEITAEAFGALVSIDTKCDKIETLEHATKRYYRSKGVILLAIDNFLSCVTQYYIRDINA